jgi:colanic acid/amylovoran biosynthesis glycosyltransferase
MLTVAYLANQFPSPVEPYVGEEIEELRRRGVRVITGSVWKRRTANGVQQADVVLQSLGLGVLLAGAWLCIRHSRQLSGLILRIVFMGEEGPFSRVKALVHTWLGVCYAAILKDSKVDHIHIHHGYFGAWIGMVAARLLHIGFSMTLHGSDLLLHGAYLDVKLANCAFCLTVSEYNRHHILEHYPEIEAAKVVVSRLGVKCSESSISEAHNERFSLLAVGRLEAVKDHAFLVRACARLRDGGIALECSIAGEGGERHKLERLIRKLRLEDCVTLLGHVPREQMDSLYDRADVMVMTSQSEGIPLVLMEAMARGKIVLAPAITGIPELIAGKSGFLYEPGSLDDFAARLLFLHSLMIRSYMCSPDCTVHRHGPTPAGATPAGILLASRHLDWVRHAARVQVRHNFNRRKNLESFADLFLRLSKPLTESVVHEDFVLQQIQLPVQRDRSVPVGTHGVAAIAGARSSAVLHG